MNPKLILKDGSEYEGLSFGAETSVSGETVFTTGMVGYPESLTDPSFRGQILVFTYPLLGNYGVPDKKFWESARLQVSGIIVCNYNSTPSHYSSRQTLAEWLKKENIPGLEIKDTRGLTLKLRERGVMLGKIVFDSLSLRGVHPTKQSLHYDKIASAALAMTEFQDPNLRNLVAEVSCKKPYIIGKGNPSTPLRAGKTIALIDCGAKFNIARSLAARGFKVVVVPWNVNPLKLKTKFSGVVISNGPGDPQKAVETIGNVKLIMAKKIPILGVCLGNQILALAAGGTTYK